MGVPAFFRWLALRYPHIIVDCVEEVGWLDSGEEVAIDASTPNPNGMEFDNLYLDMNGIIHPCTHPEDRPAPTTEEEMFNEVFRYCDRLFRIVRPRKLLYMAIDGVAPRAKINQQRSRRFRAAQEAGEKAVEEQELRKQWKESGLDVPEDSGEGPFDSNVITPGTPFMSRLAVALQRYATDRFASDPAWRDVKVLFSDASVPGEGEHKIAEFVRQCRAQPGYSPNTSHVLYGLDADLIMLALATHELHFTILREVVMNSDGRFVDKEPVRPPADKIDQLTPGAELRGYLSELGGKKPFQFLHVAVLREYLDLEYREALEDGFRKIAARDRTAPTRYDFERVIDDFVFTCFFVGNDFLPHLPSLDIREGALDFLMELYKTLVPEIGYLTDGYGNVDFQKIQRLLSDVGSTEDEVFSRRADSERRDQQRFQDQRAGRGHKRGRDGREAQSKAQLKAGEEMGMAELGAKTFNAYMPPTKRSRDEKKSNVAVADALRARLSSAPGADGTEDKPAAGEPESAPSNELQEKYGDLTPAERAEQFKETLKTRLKEKATIAEPSDAVRLGEAGWKQRYYGSKFKWDLNTPEGAEHRKELCVAYVEGLLWVMKYYYSGCPSWSWYFPYHYAPFASDLAELDLADHSFDFELAAPYKPLQQLMSVLPAVSAKGVVPDAMYELMVRKDSPIVHYYPEDFEMDLNGKRFAWQGVALLPFVDEAVLRQALEPVEALMTNEEKRRNSTGESMILMHEQGVLAQHLRKELESEESCRVVDKNVNDGLLFFEASRLPEGQSRGSAYAVQFNLLEPFKQHNPRPNPGSEPPPRTVTEAEFSQVRSGQTGWRVIRFSTLGQQAKRLRDARQGTSEHGRGPPNRGRHNSWPGPDQRSQGSRGGFANSGPRGGQMSGQGQRGGQMNGPGQRGPYRDDAAPAPPVDTRGGRVGGLAGPTAAAMRRGGAGSGYGYRDEYRGPQPVYNGRGTQPGYSNAAPSPYPSVYYAGAPYAQGGAPRRPVQPEWNAPTYAYSPPPGPGGEVQYGGGGSGYNHNPQYRSQAPPRPADASYGRGQQGAPRPGQDPRNYPSRSEWGTGYDSRRPNGQPPARQYPKR